MFSSILYFFFLWRCNPTRVMYSSFLRFLDHIRRRTTIGRTPLDEWSARRRDLYLTTHNTHNRQTSILPVGFEPKISAGERPQTYALDRAATGTGVLYFTLRHNRITDFWRYSYLKSIANKTLADDRREKLKPRAAMWKVQDNKPSVYGKHCALVGWSIETGGAWAPSHAI